MKRDLFTIKKLLTLDSMKGAKVLAGESGLNRQIKNATVIDMADLASWADENSAVIVTDYPFRSNKDLLLTAIQSLIDKNASTLCIKIRKDFQIPDELIQLCNDKKFTLIKLPISAVFSNIVYEITYTILGNKIDYFKNLQSYTEAFIKALQQAGNITERLTQIEKILKHGILFVQQGYNLHFTESTRAYLDKFGEKIYPNLRSSIKQKIQQSIDNGGIAFQTSEGRLLDEDEPAPQSFIIPFEEDELSLTLLPLIILDQNVYAILVVEDSPFESAAISALTRVSRILALEYQNLTEIKRLQKKYEDKFIINWLSGKYENDTDIFYSARAHDIYLPTNKKCCVLIISYFKDSESAGIPSLNLEALSKDNNHIAYQWLYTIYEGKITFILYFDQGDIPPAYLLDTLRSQLKDTLNTDCFRMCMSDSGNISEVPELYEQCLVINEIAELDNICMKLIQEKDLGVLPVLYPLHQSKEMQKYVKKILDPLVLYDRTHQSQLCQTLYVYLQNNSANETAKVLFTHYNTIMYRLDRIEEVLGFSIRTGDAQFRVRLAFELNRLFGNKQDWRGQA